MFFYLLEFINGPQWITALKQNIEVELGHNLTLTIEVLSNVIGSVEWFHNSELISDKPMENRSIGHTFVHSLLIGNVNWTDAGNYTVRVQNPVDTIYSNTSVQVQSSSFRSSVEPVVQCPTPESHPSTTASEG